MKIKNKNVCVTGAAGFMGSSLCRGLIKKGANVIALDNFYSSWKHDNLKEIEDKLEFVKADITDIDDMKDALFKSDIVYHLAAVDDRNACQKNFSVAFDTNIKGTHNVLSCCKNVDRFIYISSNMVYGESQYLPIDERHPIGAYESYAVTKVSSEYLCKTYDFLYDIPFTIVRNFNTFGERQNKASLIPSLIIEGLTKEKIEVWTPNVVRDFQYVENCTDALIKIVESDATIREIVNVGSGYGVTTGEVTDIICKIIGTSWVNLDKPAPVSSRLISDIRKVKALTGWKPNISLEDGLEKTIDYYKLGIK